MASVSVTKMFMAGYVPGILMAVSMMIVVAIVSKKRGYKPSREKAATFGEIMTQLKESIWALSALALPETPPISRLSSTLT